MAKKSSVARNEKRRRLSEKYAEKRQQLRAVLKEMPIPLQRHDLKLERKCQNYLEIRILFESETAVK